MNSGNLCIDQAFVGEKTNGFNSNWTVICATGGRIIVTKGSEVYNLSVGDTVFIAPDEFYNICGDAEYILLGFDGSGNSLDTLKQKAISLNEQEMQLIVATEDLINNSKALIKKEQSIKMLELLVLLCCEKENIKPYTEKNAALFTFAANILKENIKANVSVSELAERLDLSLSNLKRIFLKYSGIGVHEYYTILKIALAKELLKNGNSVTLTAELTGFANQAYFSAAFKRITGKTPKEYCANKPKEIKTAVKNKANKNADMPSYLL